MARSGYSTLLDLAALGKKAIFVPTPGQTEQEYLADLFMQREEPFKVVKVDEEKGREMLEILRKKVYTIGRLLNPFMPETSKLIKTLVIENKMPEKPLFPRYE